MRRLTFYLALALVLILAACAQPPQPTEPENPDDLSSTAFGGTGLTGLYFDNMDFTSTTATRVDTTINRAASTAAPITGIAATTYSIRWTGQIVPVYTEEYTFFLTHTDGARLMVNGQQLVSNWKDQAQVTDSGKIILQAGVKYDIRLEYYRNTANPGMVRLEWQSARQVRQVVPKDNLFPEPAIAVVAANIAGISIKPESVVLNPGEIRLVRVRFLDKDKKDLGPATSNLAQLNFLGTGYQVKWAGNGYLHVIAPTTTQSNATYSAKLTSKPAIFATATAAVVPVKAGVVVIPESSVIFPRTDYNFPTDSDASTLMVQTVGSFTDAEVAQAATQATDTMPVSPIVVREAGLPAISQGSLVSGLGATQIFGQVKSIVARRDGKVLLAVQVVNASTVFNNLPAYQQNYSQLVTGGVVPSTLTGRLELRDVQVPGQITAQAASCSTSLFSVDANLQQNVSFGTNPTIDISGSFTISGQYPLSSVTCEVYGEWRIPAPFPWNVILDPKLKVRGQVTLAATDDAGAITPPSVSLTTEFKTPIYPSGQPTASFNTNSQFLNPSPGKNFFDVTGDPGFYRATLDANISAGLVIESFGMVDDNLEYLLKNYGGVAGPYASRLRTWANVLSFFEIYVRGYGNFRITGQLASMRSALENASSKIYTKPSAGYGIEVSGSVGTAFKLFVSDILGLNIEVNAIAWEGPAVETLPGSLTATVTSNDKNGNATIGISTSSALSKVQLGYIPINGLHGKTLGISGGPVTYDKTECLNLGGSVTAKVVAIGTLPLMPQAPFNSQQTVKLLCIPSNYELITMAGRVMEISNPILPQSAWGWNLEAYTWGLIWTDKIPWSSAKDAAILQGRQLVVQKLGELNCILARNSEFPLYGIGNRAFNDYWYGWYTDQRIGAYCPR